MRTNYAWVPSICAIRPTRVGYRIVQLSGDGKITHLGILHDAVAGNDYCNGSIAAINPAGGACLVDCLHADDLAAMLAEKGLDKRPAGK